MLQVPRVRPSLERSEKLNGCVLLYDALLRVGAAHVLELCCVVSSNGNPYSRGEELPADGRQKAGVLEGAPALGVSWGVNYARLRRQTENPSAIAPKIIAKEDGSGTNCRFTLWKSIPLSATLLVLTLPKVLLFTWNARMS